MPRVASCPRVRDIARGDKVIGQLLLRRFVHPGTAMQTNDSGKGAGAIGLARYPCMRSPGTTVPRSSD